MKKVHGEYLGGFLSCSAMITHAIMLWMVHMSSIQEMF